MAGIKTQKGGSRRETRWHPAPCSTCAKPIEKLGDAYRVLWIAYLPKRRSALVWTHRLCVGGFRG
jgi:hypothetical protein